jgi:hypothetical protein
VPVLGLANTTAHILLFSGHRPSLSQILLSILLPTPPHAFNFYLFNIFSFYYFYPSLHLKSMYAPSGGFLLVHMQFKSRQGHVRKRLVAGSSLLEVWLP